MESKDLFSFESVDETQLLQAVPKKRKTFLDSRSPVPDARISDEDSKEKIESFLSKRQKTSDRITEEKNSHDKTSDFKDQTSSPSLTKLPPVLISRTDSDALTHGIGECIYEDLQSVDMKGDCAKNLWDQQEKGVDDNVYSRVDPEVKNHGELRVGYVYSKELIDACNDLPRIAGRAAVVHSLIETLGLLTNVIIISPRKGKEEEIQRFHSTDFIEFLHRVNSLSDEEKVNPEEAELYGLSYDCPVQEGIYDCAALVAGATLTAAEALCEGICDVAINWCGGWHHAQRSSASGFCYINDIVLGILKLRETFTRIVYVDLDLHHGDGVEDAFSTTPHVLTLSLHKYSPGFFPGTGAASDVGLRRGKFYSVNIPLMDGIRDAQYFAVFKRVMSSVCTAYQPQAIVCQCGADGLAGDPMGAFNLTQVSYSDCLHHILDLKLPTLVLGGGGYSYSNTARCWAHLTAVAVGQKLPQEVPDHRYYMDYSPDFEMDIQAGNRPDLNKDEELMDICSRVAENLEQIKGYCHTMKRATDMRM